MPHVRMMDSGLEDTELAGQFGMPYVVLRKMRPYDTTTLNYNWQIWETQAFSMYTTTTTRIDKRSAKEAERGILTFLHRQGMAQYHGHDGYQSRIVKDIDMASVRTVRAGLFDPAVSVGDEVEQGQLLAYLIDPCEGEVIEELRAPVDGIVFFMHGEPLTYADTAVFKLVVREE